MNEAADRDIVIAFVGTPHRINDRGSQVVKALTELGFEQFYQAEQTGWVLYVEGATDLAILKAFARTLAHPAAEVLERVFVSYVSTNLPQRARDHFWGLHEAKGDLIGLALFDRLEKKLQEGGALTELMWQRREIENYLCQEPVLMRYARHNLADDLFGAAEANRRETAMSEAIAEVTAALKTLRNLDPWSPDIKATDEFLNPLFRRYFDKLGLPNLLLKSDYHVLAGLVSKEELDNEITEKLDEVEEVERNDFRAAPTTKRWKADSRRTAVCTRKTMRMTT